MAAGAKALLEGRSADARSAFELAGKLEPKNAAATAGLKRAATLDEVLALVATAERLEKEGAVTAAADEFRKALALDSQAPRAAEGLARVGARVSGDAFASSMARGFEALAQTRYADARSAFDAANRVRPGSPEVAQALKQIEQEERTRTIAAKLATARDFESSERWAEALSEYRAVLQLDSTVTFANDGVARAAPRAEINEQLELYLTQPERLFSVPVRSSARETLQRAQAIAAAGPVLQAPGRYAERLAEARRRAGPGGHSVRQRHADHCLSHRRARNVRTALARTRARQLHRRRHAPWLSRRAPRDQRHAGRRAATGRHPL